MNTTFTQILDAIEHHDNFIITAHQNPDGDALGSMAAIGYILKHYKKNFILYNCSMLSSLLTQLHLPAPLYNQLPPHFTPQAVIVLDVSDPRRVGDELYPLIDSLYSINIDHHASCPDFASLNFVDPSYAATGCIIAELAQHASIPLTGNLGQALYLAITEDTGNFRNTNTDERSLRLASIIVANGLQVADFVHMYQNQWSLQKMKLWTALLTQYNQYYNDSVFIVPVSTELITRYNCYPEDLDGFNSFLMQINTARITITLREVHKEDLFIGVKASIRSYAVDILPLAQRFGGGGHRNAAGILFKDSSLSNVESLLATAILDLALIDEAV